MGRRGVRRAVDDPDTGRRPRLRVAYIWSSEEAASVADARQRALSAAEAALTRIRNGLGGRYYKTKKQVDDRVATIIGARLTDLITVTTGTAAEGTPAITWRRNPDAITAAAALDRLYAIATNLPDPHLTALDVLDIYKDQWTVEQRHRDLKQTLHVRSSLPAQRRPHPRADRRRRHRPARLRAHRSRPARRPRPPHPAAGHPARRDAIPTARAVLTALTDLHATYTSTGGLDRLTSVQRRILAHLDIPSHGPKHTAPQQDSRTQTITRNHAENGPSFGRPQCPPESSSVNGFPQRTVTPFATYAPWAADAAFIDTYRAVVDHTLVDMYRCWELWQLVEQVSGLQGGFVEVGVWRGGSGCLIAKRAKLYRRTERVRAHMLICTLACYLVWHLRKGWAPVTFTDEHPPQQHNPVAAAQRSTHARPKPQQTPTSNPESSTSTAVTSD